MDAYYVTFKWSEGVYCANIALAMDEETVRERYTKKYGWCDVRKASAWEVETAKLKGMPFVTITEENRK